MQFTDLATLGGVRKTEDGFLVAEANAVRTGIQLYRGSEVGLMDRDVVRVYRPEEEVRSPQSLRSFSHAPVTLDHPTVPVTADNWRDLAKGEVSTEAVWDGNHIRLPLIIKDADTIRAVEGGKRELSAGYVCDLDFTPGVTADGETYDAVQRNIHINHLAVVDRGRAGPACRIGDSAGDHWGAAPITTADEEIAMNLRNILVDGLSVQTTDAGAQAIEKLQKQLADTEGRVGAMTADHAKAMEAKDEEIGALKAENQKLKDAAPTAAQLDQMVADRSALVAQVKQLDDSIDPAGKTDADLRKAAVKAKLGDAAVGDASDAEIKGMFRALAASVADTNTPAKGADPVAKRLGDRQPMDDEQNAWLKSVADLNPQRAN